MNALPPPKTESRPVSKDAFLDKAIEHIIPAANPCASKTSKDAMDDMKAFLSGVLVFHIVGKR